MDRTIDTEAEGCPSTDRLAALVDGAADETIVRSVLAHAEHCTRCEALLGEMSDTLGIPIEARWPGDPLSGAMFGRYRLIALIGSGASALVYRAHDPVLERDVAIKLLRDGSPAVREAFVREAKALAKIEHPNVLPVYDAGETDGEPYIAVALVAGGTLTQWAERAEVDAVLALEVVDRAAAGLAAIHAAGLVHRDVKPANILVTDEGRALVADLGLAAVVDGNTGVVALAGTPRYLAPELRRGGLPTPASDQYALCQVAFELLTGRRPTRDDAGGNRRALVRAGVPNGAARALVRGLASAPEARFATIAALRKAWRIRGGQRWRTAIAGAIGATVVAAVGWLAVQRDVSPACIDVDDLARRIDDVELDPAADELAREYVASFRETTARACAAAAREPSSPQTYASASCLARHRAALDSTLRVIAAPGAGFPPIEALATLSPPAVCLSRPTAAPPPPADLAADVDAAALDLVRAKVHAELRELDRSSAIVEEVAGRPVVDAYLPLLAEVELVRGMLAREHRQLAEAASSLERAADLAERCGDTRLRLQSLTSLLTLPPRSDAEVERRVVRAAEAEALIDFVDDRWVTAGARQRLGDAAYARGAADEALRWYTASLDDLRAVLPEHHPRVASDELRIGTARLLAGDVEGAYEWQQRGLATLLHAYGERHPDVLFAKGALSQTLQERGDLRGAIALLEEVRDGFLAAPDVLVPDLVHVEAELCHFHTLSGQHEAALAACDEALALVEPSAADPRDLAWVSMVKGVALLEAGRASEAIAILDRAVGLVPDRPADDPERIELDYYLALALLAAHREPERRTALVTSVRAAWRDRPEHATELAKLDALLAE